MLRQERDGVAARFAERAVGERSESGGGRAAPDPELVERPRRRYFSAAYKLRILREVEACSRPADRPARSRAVRAAPSAGAQRRRASEGAQGDRDPGKRLCALGADARDRGRERVREQRAMIEQTVEELTPIVGTRPACRALGVAPATIYRRRRPPAPRPPRPRRLPARALSEAERQAVLAELHSDRFVDCSPAQVWATLLDEGRYLASERTMYRLLEAVHGSVRERREQLTHPPYARPELLAERPNELWSWDISKLKGPAKWTWFYLYVILDVFSRYAVGWTVQYRETAEIAKPVAFLLTDLGVTKSHSRPYTSTDNPYSEAHFKTLKYRPEFPDRFDSIEQARTFCRDFFAWYNHAHRHSGIGLMTPAAVHYGRATELHAARAHVLEAAYAARPERFVRGTPVPPTLPSAVWINKPTTKEVAS